MSSTFSVLLSMFKNEIRQCALNKSNIQYNTGTNVNPLLAGQRITRSEIEKTLSFQIMNPYEKQVVNDLLDSMVKMDATSNEQNKQLIKKIPGIMPYTGEDEQVVTNIMPFVKEEQKPVEFKDAA